MGITGELVRSVFSKSRSNKTHDTHARDNHVVHKNRWRSTVRAYLCGDELFESASVKSSETTVTQQVVEESESIERTDDLRSQDENSEYEPLLDEDAAAIIIQSAFRGFMVRRLRTVEYAGVKKDFVKGVESPSRQSLATSIEVQTGNSVGVVSIQEGDPSVSNKLQFKHSIFGPKEDWDDSTVDSYVSKVRIQNRREAMTRRERALAYAFSQQLRICSKKKQMKSDGMETNMGWSWLERWMATRQPEASSVEDCISKQLKESVVTMKTKTPMGKTFLDLSFEERESCGSNEVPALFFGSKNTDAEYRDGCNTPRNRFKATRNISRRKTAPAYHYQKEHAKVSTRDGTKDVMSKRQKMRRIGSQKETGCKGPASVLLSPDHSINGQNSKSDP